MEYLMNYAWAVLIVMVVGLFLWQNGVFNSGQNAPIITGFKDIKPMPPTIVYFASTSVFETAFVNAAGVPIEVTDVQVDENSIACMNIEVNGQSMPGSVVVAEGDLFRVKAVCSSKQPDEGYTVHIRVTYNARLKDAVTPHSTEGWIQYYVED